MKEPGSGAWGAFACGVEVGGDVGGGGGGGGPDVLGAPASLAKLGFTGICGAGGRGWPGGGLLSGGIPGCPIVLLKGTPAATYPGWPAGDLNGTALPLSKG